MTSRHRILRGSLMASRVLCNRETWYNITKDQYSKLEEIDEMFLKKIFEVPKSTPRLSLYVECGKIPLRFVIKTRRLMFYWHVLNLDKRELLYKFYEAQKLRSVKNDWVRQIDIDKAELGLENLSEEDIRNTSKERFRKFVHKRIVDVKKKDFSKIVSKQSKTKDLDIGKCEDVAEYLTSKNLCVKEIQTLLKLKTRMISVKNNFKAANIHNMWCQTCVLFTETQEHL